MSRVLYGTEEKTSTSPFLPWMSYEVTKGLTALTPEIGCNQMAMGLLPITSAAIPLSYSFW
jgi:hypothetical protein